MAKPEITNIIKVGGAQLSPDCINTLENLQEQSNAMLNSFVTILLKSIAMLAISTDETGSSAEKAHELIVGMATVVEHLEILKA